MLKRDLSDIWSKRRATRRGRAQLTRHIANCPERPTSGGLYPRLTFTDQQTRNYFRIAHRASYGSHWCSQPGVHASAPEGFLSPMTWGVESHIIEGFGQ